MRTLVAHEPPLLELLPDATEQRAATEAIIDTFHTDGLGAAWMKFMRNAGFDCRRPTARCPFPRGAVGGRRREAARFFDIDLRPTTQYLPDIEALKASGSRVVVGMGVESRSC